ncbi:MAG: hypothetical protein MI754_00245 [Chromatiales bacterium]|nr:hypothetical protein [Chromatiales bacterium]
MSNPQQLDTSRLAQIVWLSLLIGILLLGGLIWFLSTSNASTPLDGEVLQIIFIVGILSALPALLLKLRQPRRTDQTSPII